MLSLNKIHNENSNIHLNYSTLYINYNIDSTFYNQLISLTRYSINSILNKYKRFSYLINKQLELSLVFTSNKVIEQINGEWRKIVKPTNVLSMAMFSKEDTSLGLILLGDVVISIEKAATEAIECKISLQEHILRLLLHGILHIFEFDHNTDKEASIMQEWENKILKHFSSNMPGLTSNY